MFPSCKNVTLTPVIVSAYTGPVVLYFVCIWEHLDPLVIQVNSTYKQTVIAAVLFLEVKHECSALLTQHSVIGPHIHKFDFNDPPIYF